MVKRKVDFDSEDEAQFSDASSEAKHKMKPPAKKAAHEKTKPEPSTASSSTKKLESKIGSIQKNSEGEKYIELGKKKRVTIRSFRNIPLLDIREYYGTDSEEKPGKKGVSLTLEQWQILKTNLNTIDELFSDLSKVAK